MEAATANGGGKLSQLGGSLPVENVQALASSEDLIVVPRRYIRSDVVADFLCTDDDEIPVIDFGRLLDVSSFEAEATTLKLACEEWGFFQVSFDFCSEVLVYNLITDAWLLVSKPGFNWIFNSLLWRRNFFQNMLAELPLNSWSLPLQTSIPVNTF